MAQHQDENPIEVGGALHHLTDRKSKHTKTMFEFSIQPDQIPVVLEQLRQKGSDASWVVFMFYTPTLGIERHNPKANSNEHNLDSAQIEHIFPKSPKLNDWDTVDLPDLKKSLDVMGNLTLTMNNQSLSNGSFMAKKKGKNGYVKSPYWLTKTLMPFKKWTKVEVDKRGERLLKVALKIWPCP